jgi:hypothetical protein
VLLEGLALHQQHEGFNNLDVELHFLLVLVAELNFLDLLHHPDSEQQRNNEVQVVVENLLVEVVETLNGVEHVLVVDLVVSALDVHVVLALQTLDQL